MRISDWSSDVCSSDLDRLDVNGDSILERNEWPPRYADRIAELDKNKDGKVTSGEFFDTLMARFDSADTNHDPVLTSEERMADDIPKDQREDDADGVRSEENKSELKSLMRTS